LGRCHVRKRAIGRRLIYKENTLRDELVTTEIHDGLARALGSPVAMQLVEDTLVTYLARCRWFGLKDRTVEKVRIANVADFGAPEHDIVLCEVEVATASDVSRWFMPLGILWSEEPDSLPNRLALTRVTGRGTGILTDGFALPDFTRQVFDAVIDEKTVPCDNGYIQFRSTDRLKALTPDVGAIKWLSAEQSNSSLIIDDAAMLKIYRRITSGQHPEAEMSRYLTMQGFTHAPSLLGDVVHIAADGTPSTLAILLQFVPNEGDAWSWIVDRLNRALDAQASSAPDPMSSKKLLEECDDVIAAIGRRLGEMHTCLAVETPDPDFTPEVASAADTRDWAAVAKERLDKAFEVLSHFQTWEREPDRMKARKLLNNRKLINSAVDDLSTSARGTLKTRTHGDFHLGQVLVAGGDAYIIDFEGEPAASLTQRRAKTSPIRDVAGLLRSIDYAAATMVGRNKSNGELEGEQSLTKFVTRSSDLFLHSYGQAGGSQPGNAERALLDLFLIEKAAYEICYEAANRPSWIGVPLAGLAKLAVRITATDESAKG
jgi:maltose alpha-D-glucosyltransferase/alpha-amylase